MAFPDDLTMVTVRHKVVGTNLKALAGNNVSAVVTGRRWVDGGSIIPTTYNTKVAADGTYEFVLPAVDQFDDVEAYRITETVPGRPAPFYIAPMVADAPGPVDAKAILSPKPAPGGGISYVTGPVTDSTMAEVAGDPSSAFTDALRTTIGTEVDTVVTGAIADNPQVATDVADVIEQRALVTAANVRRIVASTDPDEPLVDGDLLLIYDEPATEFHDLTTLTGLTRRWDTSGTFSIVDDATATGGKALRFTTSSLTRNLLSLDAADTAPDRANVEVVTRVKTPGQYSSAGAGIALRGAGEAGAETGLIATVYNSQLRLMSTLNGASLAVLAQEPFVPGADQWYWIRARANGDLFMAKAWIDGDPEPAEWTRVVNVPTITGPGWVGLYGSSTAYVQTWDMVGVGLEGAAAPKEA